MLSLADIGTILTRFGASLAKSGSIRLRNNLEVKPPDPCETKIHFEQSPKGHLILKVELKWGEEAPVDETGNPMRFLLDEVEQEQAISASPGNGGETP
jgi:hypothetical protein